MSVETVHEASDAAQRLAAAHRALRADRSIQFDLRPADPPPAPPEWLLRLGKFLGDLLAPIGRFFAWIGSFMPDAPYARIFLWTVLALLVLALLWVVVERIRHGEWRLPRRRSRQVLPTEAEEEAWQPDIAIARQWLAEADRLAAQGQFAEAVHHLLFRSVEDIERRRPRIVRPSRTSRELGAEPEIPVDARNLFGRIAAMVERSLFGGRAVSADEWTEARGAYAQFALPQAWQR